MDSVAARRLPLFPITSQVDSSHRLTLAGLDLTALAQTYATPLYLYDQLTMEQAVGEYREALAAAYSGPTAITYAGKAFLCVAMAQWTQEQDLWLDCTGEGELHIAAVAGLPRERILVHGVNKSDGDLAAAVAQAGVIVVDNPAELERLIALAPPARMPDLWLRVRPGLAVETHRYTQTGQEESKFGMSPQEAIGAARRALALGLPLTGLHFHQGSHFHDPAPVAPALETVLDLILELNTQTGWTPQVLCPGGGWGVAYHESDLPHAPIRDYVARIAHTLEQGCRLRQLSLPRLHLEPGRSLVAQAGVALYRVEAVKESGGRRWLLLDGGLADNPRPALYGARYSALPTTGLERPMAGSAWLAGPYCESGDILIQDLPMPNLQVGELVAIPVSGAYQLSMGSNYNGARKPAVLWLRAGQAHLVQRREVLADLTARDTPLYSHPQSE